MRTCPNCGEPIISRPQLYLYALTKLNTVHCKNCYTVIGFNRDRESFIGGVLSSIAADILIIVTALLSIIYTGNIASCIFILLSMYCAKAYYIYKGSLTQIN
jgi:hypothetical protein